MGLNTSFLMIGGVTAAEAEYLFKANDMFAPGGEINSDVAVSQSLHPDLALGAVGGWAVFWNSNGQILAGDTPQNFSRGRRALGAALGSVDSRYGFFYYVDGALKRGVTYGVSEVLEQVGAALPEETELSTPARQYDEDHIFEMVTRLTGVSFADLCAAPYQRLEFLG